MEEYQEIGAFVKVNELLDNNMSEFQESITTFIESVQEEDESPKKDKVSSVTAPLYRPSRYKAQRRNEKISVKKAKSSRITVLSTEKDLKSKSLMANAAIHEMLPNNSKNASRKRQSHCGTKAPAKHVRRRGKLSNSDTGTLQPEPFIWQETQVLKNDRFLDIDQLYDVINTLQAQYQTIPTGKKENVYFTVWNKENVDRRKNGKSSRFADDCGSWDTKTGSTATTELVRVEGELINVYKRKGTYCYRSNGRYLPMVSTRKDIIIMKRYYANLRRDRQYRKRVTWFEQLPGASTDTLCTAVVEYVGKYPDVEHLHGNSKSLRNS